MFNRVYLILIVALMMMNLASASLFLKLGDDDIDVVTTVVNNISNSTNRWDNLDTPADILHNDLSTKQGGSSGEYYHLNSSTYNYLLSNLWSFIFGTYNVTYATWSYNQTYSGSIYNSSYESNYNSSYESTYNSTYNTYAYNMSDGVGEGNVSWNQSLANTLYAEIIWGYNQTYSGSIYNDSYESTFNQTYNDYSYNQTTATNTIYGRWWYNMSTAVYNMYGQWFYNMTSSSETIYNSTYDIYAHNETYNTFTTWGKFFYNMTEPFTTWLGTFNYNYNQTYSGEIYNATYEIYAYNQTSGVYNSSYESAYNSTYNTYAYNMSDGSGGNSSWNESYASTLYVNITGDTMTGALVVDAGGLYDIAGGTDTNDMLVLRANIADGKPYIALYGNGDGIAINPNAGEDIAFIDDDTGFATWNIDGSSLKTNFTIGDTGRNLLFKVYGGANFTYNITGSHFISMEDRFCNSSNCYTLAQLLSTESTGTYNVTYATWSYNQTYSGSIYNSSYESTYNSTYNTYAYNQTAGIYNSSYESNYNVTYDGLINNASYLSTYNSTYHTYAYNQTTITNTTIFNAYNSLWTSVFNSTYDTWLGNYTAFNKYWYNMSEMCVAGSYNVTYETYAYNQTYSGSIYNVSYDSWLGNHTLFSKYWYNQTSGVYNSSYESTYNSTYDTWLGNYTSNNMFWYNMTYSGSIFNSTYESSYNISYAGSLNNASYLSTYNATYNQYAYNMTSSMDYTNIAMTNKTNTFAEQQVFSKQINTTNISLMTNKICGDTGCTKYISFNGSSWLIQN